ncbi:hypothetical protein niasHT_003513 [Heterodera trifolii]|uniref:Post-SET domain-containing protein n=1 Tax=Heterodera trifolii TaxID=157864 RepID=A0ABD2M3Q5_9BILA
MTLHLLLVLPVLAMAFAFGNCQSQTIISGSGCVYHNGWVTESGRSRPLTTNERSQLDNYQRQSQSAAAAFSAAFRPPFPFGGPINPQLNLPQMPCFCSAASCAGGVSWVNN